MYIANHLVSCPFDVPCAHDLQSITDTRVVNRKVSGVNTTDIQNVVGNKTFLSRSGEGLSEILRNW